MFFYEKKVGETPLEMLNRVRIEKSEFENSKLSYAGRLDPMAHGEMLVLVDEENKEHEKHLGYDKKYQATFLFGVSTDSGDILGLIVNNSIDDNNCLLNTDLLDEAKIKKEIFDFKKIKKQKYPWFSSMTVEGLKLFDHFKKGNLNIKRPEKKVQIIRIEKIEFDEIFRKELRNYIFTNISKVKGEFRQKETLEGWNNLFLDKALIKNKIFVTVKLDITVSSGTYIRGLSENFKNPATLLSLKRLKIIV